jgi:hypothetical protein
MRSRQSQFGLRCGVRTQLVSHQHVGREAVLFEQLAHQFHSCSLVASPLHSRSRTSPSSSTACQSQKRLPAIRTAISSRCHVWMPPFAQDGFESFGRVIGCCHVSGLQVRPVTTAGRYGDARTRRKSVRRAFELDGIYCISRPGSDRSFALTVPRPPYTPNVPLAAQPNRGSGGRSHKTSIIFPLCQHGPD